MPYMELRDYRDSEESVSKQQVEQIMSLTRDHLARGQEIDGTFEFRYLPKVGELDYCEYDYIYVIDMGFSSEREARKAELAHSIGVAIAPVLNTDSLAVRLRLQNAGFVPIK